MAYCPKCGTLIGNDAQFCPTCGASIKASFMPPAQYVAPPVPKKNLSTFFVVAIVLIVIVSMFGLLALLGQPFQSTNMDYDSLPGATAIDQGLGVKVTKMTNVSTVSKSPLNPSGEPALVQSDLTRAAADGKYLCVLEVQVHRYSIPESGSTYFSYYDGRFSLNLNNTDSIGEIAIFTTLIYPNWEDMGRSQHIWNGNTVTMWLVFDVPYGITPTTLWYKSEHYNPQGYKSNFFIPVPIMK